MNINFYQKGINLSDQQKDYVTKKLEVLSQKFIFLSDESSLIKVEVEFFESGNDNKNIHMSVNAVVPGGHLRAEEDSLTIEEAIDLIEDKLKIQLEKFKETRKS